MEESKRWGAAAVNLSEWSFPALKALRALQALPREDAGTSILDYGCGEGKLLRTVKQVRPLAKLNGVDIRPPLDTGTFRFFLIAKDGEVSQELPHEEFDTALSIDVLEHVADPKASLRAIQAALKPGGRLSCFIPAEGQPLSFYTLYRALLGKQVYVKTKDHRNAYTRKQWIELVSHYFEIEKVSYSYHLIGSFMDSTFFALQIFKPLMNWWWNKNTYYRPEANKDSLNVAMRLANGLCYWESRLLAHVPLGASGVHIIARKR